MKLIIKRLFQKIGLDISRYAPNIYDSTFISIAPKGNVKGNVLLSYRVEPFLLKPDEKIPNSHTNYWESFQISKTFLDMGFIVDVIDYRNRSFIPGKNYSIFVGARTNFERLVKSLNPECINIVHLDTAHWLFNNYASYARAIALQRRRGVTIKTMKLVEPNLAIEYADCATILGNKFTIRTYTYIHKPIYRIPISTCNTYPWPEDKDYHSSRKNYLWFGSEGLVHKGLDLVLEAFAEMPDYHLYICGPIKHERDFEMAYHKELYQTPNIHTIGWVNTDSPEFIKIAKNCVGIVYPSCSEGQAGAVIQCMHAGLIPIVSYESGIDVDSKSGIVLEESSITEIRKAVQAISTLSSETLKCMSRQVWEYVRQNHTRERFAAEYKRVITHILETTKKAEHRTNII